MTNSLLTEKDVAKMLSISIAAVRRRRFEKRPPKWIKIGASVRYLPEDLESFISSCAKSLDAPDTGKAA